jgi:glycogen debranching enzyme
MPHFRLPSAEEDFMLVRSREGRGVYASASPLYRDAIFGRDSLETADDLLPLMPEVAREVILCLTGLQGTKLDHQTEEEPGKIHHEYRHIIMDGRRISPRSEEILHQLASRWGGTDEEMIYYGSADATPLYIRLVADYCTIKGKDILATQVRRRDGQDVSVREAVLDALQWLEMQLDNSDLGLLEFCRQNPFGHAYQVWKDGYTSYLHTNGKRANPEKPMAAIEVQGYAYDALVKGSWLFSEHRYRVARWHKLAQRLQAATFKHFWMPRERYFALALDRDQKDRVRQVATHCSNPALLLDTMLFDSLPEHHRQSFVGAIVSKIYSENFLTAVGIRCRSTKHRHLLNFASYHGVWAVWAKETYDVAKGLRRQGFSMLGEQLETRILNGIALSGKHYEFWYVHPDGRVQYDPDGRFAASDRHEIIAGTHEPEDTQAWTISAALAIRHYLQNTDRRPTAKQEVWQEKLENQLLKKQTKLPLLLTEEEVAKVFPQKYSFTVDVKLGRRRRNKYVGQQED